LFAKIGTVERHSPSFSINGIVQEFGAAKLPPSVSNFTGNLGKTIAGFER
jgi:hypothetical protein